MFEDGKWLGGSESAMFNRLENISEMMQPVTPFLQVTFNLLSMFACIDFDTLPYSSAV